MSLKHTPITRINAADGQAADAYFRAGPLAPCIFTNAVGQWPATAKWRFDFFAREYGDNFGHARLGFGHGYGSKVTKLSAFIEHLGADISEVPGFWLDPTEAPLFDAPTIAEEGAWSFTWQPFAKHPELRADIEPFPFPRDNFVTGLDDNAYRLLQSVTRIDFHAIYLSRAGTITPLHADFHETFGCLVQFEGRKQVSLIAPGDYAEGAEPQFNPEAPDFVRFPAMRGCAVHQGTLAPGEMLIIPPNWWHFTRSIDHALILSHNFFNQSNLSGYLRCLFQSVLTTKDRDALFANLAKRLAPEAD